MQITHVTPASHRRQTDLVPSHNNQLLVNEADPSCHLCWNVDTANKRNRKLKSLSTVTVKRGQLSKMQIRYNNRLSLPPLPRHHFYPTHLQTNLQTPSVNQSPTHSPLKRSTGEPLAAVIVPIQSTQSALLPSYSRKREIKNLYRPLEKYRIR